METMVQNSSKIVPKGIVCQEDLQEKLYLELLQLWINDKMAYDKLIENMPDPYKSRWHLVLKKLLKLT